MLREILKSAPREFTQHARNPANSVQIGGKNVVFAPAYGSPFVMDLDRGRRFGTLEDFQNFIKLAQSSPEFPPLWRHDLRADRYSGEQAASGYGAGASDAVGPALYGVGDLGRARRRQHRDVPHRCLAAIL